MVRAAKHYDVIYFEEPIVDSDAASMRAERVEHPCGVTAIAAVVPASAAAIDVLEYQRSLVQGVLGSRSAEALLWYYTPMALAISGSVEPRLRVYDCMDELSAFRGAPPGLIEREQELLQRADVVFTGGRSLFEAKRDRHPNVHCFPSSVDGTHFAAARAQLAAPRDQATIPEPRIGFFGVVDERMDVDLVGRLAAIRPNWHFVIIGPVVKIDPASLPRAANLHWLGQKSYDELPHYLAGWSAGFMPFALNEATRFISPTKTPEFLAAGLPVASTAIADVVRPYGDERLVAIAGSAEEMVESLSWCLSAASPEWQARVDRFLSLMSWDRTFEGMRGVIEHAMLERAGDKAGLPREPQAPVAPTEAIIDLVPRVKGDVYV